MKINDLLWSDGNYSEAEEDTGPADEDEIPEPEEDVNLFIDDVERQHTQTINIHNGARGSIFVHGTCKLSYKCPIT